MAHEGLFSKIHFIKIYDFGYKNAGDIYSGPFLWFADFFNKYSCISHSLSSVRYDLISKNDVVIIGGGGILNYNPWFNFNEAINNILDICDNVILWGAGFNCTIDEGDIASYNPSIDFSRFRLYGVRDYNFMNLNYVPCPSCVNPLIQKVKNTSPTNKYGSMLHPLMEKPSLPIQMDDCSHFNNIYKIFDFISQHETIVTNSYHATYWSLLAGRKVVAPAYLLKGNKFSYLEYQPSYASDWNNLASLNEAIANANKYEEFLDECQERTFEFYYKVQDIINDVIPIPDKSFELFYMQNNMAEYFWKLRK